MTRFVTTISSVLLAYGVCVLSGINRWMYAWLKAFYPWYAAVMWVTLAVVFVVCANGFGRLHKSLITAGGLAGYFAGIIAYHFGPALMDGSLARSASTIKADGVWEYLEAAAFSPLLLLTPIAGVVAAVAFAALSRSTRTDRYLAATVAVLIFVAGWAFFLTR